MGYNFAIQRVHTFLSRTTGERVNVLIVRYPNGPSVIEQGEDCYLWFTEEDLFDQDENCVRYPGDREFFPTDELAALDAEQHY